MNHYLDPYTLRDRDAVDPAANAEDLAAWDAKRQVDLPTDPHFERYLAWKRAHPPRTEFGEDEPF